MSLEKANVNVTRSGVTTFWPSLMYTPEQFLHDRVNLVRLVRRLDKSVNESDWGYEKSMALWLRAEGLLQVGPFSSSLSLAIQ
jgi:hypothetical protein